MTNIVHKELSYTVRGVLIDVYNKLGPSLPEKFYQEAVTHGLENKGIACTPEKQFQVIYRNRTIGEYYVDHWLEGGKIILEIKVAPKIMPIHQAQTLSYLKLSKADLAIIANYGTKSLQDKRLPNFLAEKASQFQWQPQAVKDALYPELSNRLLKALYQVYFILGTGFIHRVYRQAMMVELEHQGLNYEKINKIPVYYQKRFLGMQSTQMVKVENKIMLAVFALKMMNEEMIEMNMKARLKRLGMNLGVLANFYGEELGVKVVRAED